MYKLRYVILKFPLTILILNLCNGVFNSVENMRLLTRCFFMKHVTNIYRNSKKQNTCTSTRQYTIILASRRQALRYPVESIATAGLYSSDSKKQFITFEKKTNALKDALEQKKEQLKDTEQRIRLRGEEIVSNLKHRKEITGEKFRTRKDHLLKDILETKAKVKERLEGVVEVVLSSNN